MKYLLTMKFQQIMKKKILISPFNDCSLPENPIYSSKLENNILQTYNRLKIPKFKKL